jgi:phthalate 4,5-dioxygenase
VRLLGEDLLAFRNSDGVVGLVQENCPHRRASLYFGRNEECGIRCIYHGWKFDITGQCVDLPSEPDESNFREKIQITAYPCVERAGFVWTYMGPLPAPELPRFEWMDLPDDHHVVSMRVQPSNWLQALEGEFDQSHVSYLHSRLQVNDGSPRSLVDRIRFDDRRPIFDVVNMPYGTCIGAGRKAPEHALLARLAAPHAVLRPHRHLWPQPVAAVTRVDPHGRRNGRRPGRAVSSAAPAHRR